MAAATVAGDSAPAAKRVRLHAKTPPVIACVFDELSCEDEAARQQIYIATVARVLPGTRALTDYKDVALAAPNSVNSGTGIG